MSEQSDHEKALRRELDPDDDVAKVSKFLRRLSRLNAPTAADRKRLARISKLFDDNERELQRKKEHGHAKAGESDVEFLTRLSNRSSWVKDRPRLRRIIEQLDWADKANAIIDRSTPGKVPDSSPEESGEWAKVAFELRVRLPDEVAVYTNGNEQPDCLKLVVPGVSLRQLTRDNAIDVEREVTAFAERMRTLIGGPIPTPAAPPKESAEAAPAEVCPGCKNEIDLDVCHCGDSASAHDVYPPSHSFVPMGCDCGRSSGKAKRKPGDGLGVYVPPPPADGVYPPLPELLEETNTVMLGMRNAGKTHAALQHVADSIANQWTCRAPDPAAPHLECTALNGHHHGDRCWRCKARRPTAAEVEKAAKALAEPDDATKKVGEKLGKTLADKGVIDGKSYEPKDPTEAPKAWRCDCGAGNQIGRGSCLKCSRLESQGTPYDPKGPISAKGNEPSWNCVKCGTGNSYGRSSCSSCGFIDGKPNGDHVTNWNCGKCSSTNSDRLSTGALSVFCWSCGHTRSDLKERCEAAGDDSKTMTLSAPRYGTDGPTTDESLDLWTCRCGVNNSVALESCRSCHVGRWRAKVDKCIVCHEVKPVCADDLNYADRGGPICVSCHDRCDKGGTDAPTHGPDLGESIGAEGVWICHCGTRNAGARSHCYRCKKLPEGNDLSTPRVSGLPDWDGDKFDCSRDCGDGSPRAVASQAHIDGARDPDPEF